MKIPLVKTGVDYVTSNRDRFFRYPDNVESELVSTLVFDCMIGKCSDISYRKFNSWHVVASTKDWLSTNYKMLPTEDLFDKLVAMPEAGQNMHRSEVLVNAESSGLAVYLNAIREFNRRRSDDIELLDKYVAINFPFHRVICFSI